VGAKFVERLIALKCGERALAAHDARIDATDLAANALPRSSRGGSIGD
jgi:hypothetical protein